MNAAALFALLGIGILYFNAQIILAIIAFAVVRLQGTATGLSGDFMQRLVSSMKLLAGPIRISLLISQYLFMLLPTLWLVRRWHTLNVREYIRLKGTSFREVLLAILGTMAILPTGTFIANEFTRRLGIPEPLRRINEEIFTAHSDGEFFWLVGVVAITPAICEEIFFRGYVQRTFARTIGWKSVILVGVIFGLFHMQPLGLVTLSLLGVFFGYCYYRSRSLLPSMAAHFTNNFIAILLLYQTSRFGDIASADQIPVAWVLISLPIAGIVLFAYHRTTAALQRGDHENND